MNDIIAEIMKCPIFTGIDKKDVSKMFNQVKVIQKQFCAGATIFHEGDISREIGIILKGSLELKKYQSNGNVISVFQRQDGEVIGGAIMFSQNKCYPYDIVSVTDTEIAFIERKDLLVLLSNSPVLTANMLEFFAERILHFERKLELLSFSSIQKKIAYSLLYDFNAEDHAVIYLPFTRQGWAEYLNVSRPSLSRELKLMCENGIIEYEKNQIRILDCLKLEQLMAM